LEQPYWAVLGNERDSGCDQRDAPTRPAVAVVADDRSPRPANLGDHLIEPGKILGIDLPKRLKIVRPARRLVPFHPAQEFCPQARIHAIRMSPGPKQRQQA
jgi:hypothetical protein